MTKTPEDIKNSVLEKIRLGEIRKRPRVYFVVQIILVLLTAFLALLASVFAVNLALFSLRESGQLFLLGFGVRGFFTFLSLFPWVTVVGALLLVFIFERLLHRFKFTYRRSILGLFVGLVVLVVVGGILVPLTPLHTALLEKSDRGELPFFDQLYKGIRIPHEEQGEFRGVIISIATSTLTITHNDHDTDIDDGIRVIRIPEGFDIQQLHVGDRVYIAGDMASDTVNAYGLQRF